MRQHQIYDTFLQNKEKLTDPQWLEDFIRPHCKITRMGWRGMRPWIIQFPKEFVAWLMLLRERQVKTYVEIGTSTGGTFYFTDSYLRATVPGYIGAVGFDLRDKLRNFDLYKPVFPATEFYHMNSKDINLGDRQFDAGFIDARHEEAWVHQDFGKLKNNCRIVGFHDIVLHQSTVHLAWSAIKASHEKHWEFIDYSAPAEARCGIGAVELRNAF